MKVLKRNNQLETFDLDKIKKAVKAAYKSKGKEVDGLVLEEIDNIPTMMSGDVINIEKIQDIVVQLLMDLAPYDVALAYILYREEHKTARFIRERIDYMQSYETSNDNAASSSETDANANVGQKNVANLEGEVYKATNRIIQRQRMKDKLNELFPEVAKQYEKDLESHIIYTHDEASSPTLKYYCCAVTLYPLMLEGVGNIDGITPTPPNDIQSFSGQVTNLAFLLSSQCKGAVAFGDYFITLNYYVIKEFGPKWYENIDAIVTNKYHTQQHTMAHYIRKGMKQFIYGVNQPAGNRSYNCPFTNVSYYDKYYFQSLFEGFCYPDGTTPEWEAIDKLQRMFMELHRELRLIKPLTFPVSTMALVYDNNDYLDKDYKELCAEEWAKGGSFFLYSNDNTASLASCCRVLNEMSDNTFSSTTGMTGVMTGSCNVITLNINRIVQDVMKEYASKEKNPDSYMADGTFIGGFSERPRLVSMLYKRLKEILDRVYKYHIAYKTMLYDMEDKKMFAASNGGYIAMKKLYSTIGIIGYAEAAQFLGASMDYRDWNYTDFLKEILSTIKNENKKHSIYDKDRPFLFNSEAIPGENAAVKFYNWDKNDGYWVPEDQNLYCCYFFNPWKRVNIINSIKLHGKEIVKYTDGGQAAHINLDTHLSKEQYLKLMDIFRIEGTNYVTFNIPMSECKDCGHVVNAPIIKCKCGSTNIRYWTRIIGYLTSVDNWSNERQKEYKKRIFQHPEIS